MIEARQMDDSLGGIALCAASYLYGSVPFVALLARGQVDLRRYGSGNVGGGNLWAAAGAARGITGGLGDVSKGLLPVLAGRIAGLPVGWTALVGACGMAGQAWPVWLRFHGGRGQSAYLGASFALSPLAFVISAVPMAAGALWRLVPVLRRRRSAAEAEADVPNVARAPRSRAVPLGSLLGVLVFPLAYMLVAPRRDFPATAVSLLLPLVLVLRRLTAPLPDDGRAGPAITRRALLYRLLYDRNTRD
jgi:glycerol-3-phosphate acyltransferase PlsY